LAIIHAICFGWVQEFIGIAEEMKTCFNTIYIGEFFNVPKWFDPQGLNKQFRELRACMDKFYKKMINVYKEDQRRKPSKERKKPLLDIFLEQLDFPENGITEENIEGLIYVSNFENTNLKFYILISKFRPIINAFKVVTTILSFIRRRMSPRKDHEFTNNGECWLYPPL